MTKFGLALALAFSAHAATVLRVECGGPGDFGYDGGTAWTASNQAGLPMSMRFAPSLTYTLRVAAGQYQVTLDFLEPNKTRAGERVFSVALNGNVIAPSLDLYGVAGLLVPYQISATVTAGAGGLQVRLVGAMGNAVISRIQVDSVDVPPPAAGGSWCEGGVGDGTGVLFSVFGALPPIHWFGCYNTSGGPLGIASVRCATDGTQVNVVDVMVADSAGKLQSILTAPITCTSLPAPPVIVPAIAGVRYADNEPLHIFVRVGAPAEGQQSPTQVVWIVKFQ